MKVEGKGGKGRSVLEIEAEEQAGPTGPVVVSMSTPPKHQLPLFTPEQLQGFRMMYQQAPLLHPAFQTPMTVTRPPLEHEEREGLRRLRLEEAGEEERRGLEERARLVRTEREEMSRQLQYLIMENRRLKDQAIGVMAVERKKEEQEELRSRQIQAILDENRLLKDNIQRLVARDQKEDEVLFATPNGSSAREEDPGQAHHGGLNEEVHDDDRPGHTGKGTGGRKKESQGGDGIPPQTVDVVLKLLQGMQDLQKKLVKGRAKDDHGGDDGSPELVQRGVELPKLPEWSPETGPIDFSDWLLVIQPMMGDLSSSSEEWWQAMVAAARKWYTDHMGKTPLDRLQHHPEVPPSLQLKKWSRLERRASSLLLAALPEGLREVVSSRSLTTLGILTKGMTQYQPGGLAEKSAILAALESPPEAGTIAHAAAMAQVEAPR